jgi:hypothetical protein
MTILARRSRTRCFEVSSSKLANSPAIAPNDRAMKPNETRKDEPAVEPMFAALKDHEAKVDRSDLKWKLLLVVIVAAGLAFIIAKQAF